MIKALAKTIEIFLPDGDPKSIKVASITSRAVQITYIPRTKLDEAKKRDNLNGVGVYILVGMSEEHAKPEVYIGEAESCMVRLGQHNASKDFWQYALVITSRINQFTKTHGKYLEWLCYDSGKQANRCQINNSTIPTKPHVSEPMEADLHDSFETVSILVSTLGLPLFQPARGNEGKIQTPSDDSIFHIKGRNGEGNGLFTDEGFVVLAGAKLAKELSPTVQRRSPKFRDKYLMPDLVEDKKDYYLLKEDIVCNSPSTAAAVVVGHSVNGWKLWKQKDGNTLSDIYRKEG